MDGDGVGGGRGAGGDFVGGILLTSKDKITELHVGVHGTELLYSG